MKRKRKKKKWGLVSIAAVISVAGGIAATSESIVNSTIGIYTKIRSALIVRAGDPVMVDILISKPSDELMEKFGFANGEISDNKKSEIDKVIDIRPDQDIFNNDTSDSSARLQNIHCVTYFAPDEGEATVGWTASYPIIDIVVSPKEYKKAINISEIIFRIDPNNSQQDETPYLEVIGEEAVLFSLTVVNQGWSKIKEAKIEYDIAGQPSSYKDARAYVSKINPEKSAYEHLVPLMSLVNGEVVVMVDLENHLRKKFGKSKNDYENEVHLKRQMMKDSFESAGIYVGVVGLVSAIAESPAGQSLTYKGYFRSLVTLGIDNGFGGGYMDVNGRDIVRFRSDLSVLEYTVPVTFRLDEKDAVYRTQIMLISDQTATYRFQFSLIGQAQTLYLSPMVNSFIFVPRVSAKPIYEKLYSRLK